MKNLANEVYIYPINMLNDGKKVYVAEGNNLFEVVKITLVLTPTEDFKFEFCYKLEVHDRIIYVNDNSIKLYESPEDFRKGQAINKKAVILDEILRHAEMPICNYFHTVLSGETIQIASYNVVPGGCKVVARDVTEISIDYNEQVCNITGDMDITGCVTAQRHAEYYQDFHVIAADGSETIEEAPINRFRLTKEQTALVDKFVALYEQMKREHIAFLFDSENDETYFINKPSEEAWISSYEEQKGYEKIDFDAVASICPSHNLSTDWTNCDYDLMYKLPTSEK